MELKNLVFGGGCVHGFGYVGAIAALDHLNFLKSIKKVAGISPGGALTATLLAFGYSVDDLIANLVKKDLEHMLDDPLPEAAPKKSSSGGLNCCGGGSAAEMGTPSESDALDPELSHTLQVHSGAKLHKWLSTIIEKSTLRPNCTFAELHEFVTGKRNVSLLRRGAVFRDLVLVGYNLSSNYCFVFSYESTPEAIIADAVRIAVALPYLFTPWAYYMKEGARAERVVSPGYENIFWIDGGIVQPYPVTIFDSDTSPKSTTLGLCLTNQQELIQYTVTEATTEEVDPEGENADQQEPPKANHRSSSGSSHPMTKPVMQSIWDYNAAILQSGFYRHVLDDTDATNRTVFISNCGLNPLRMGISNQDKNRLLESGWNSVMAKLYSGDGSQDNKEVTTAEFPKCSVRIKE